MRTIRETATYVYEEDAFMGCGHWRRKEDGAVTLWETGLDHSVNKAAVEHMTGEQFDRGPRFSLGSI